MNEHKLLIKNTSIIAIGNMSTKLISFFLLPLYTALLSTEQYGDFDYIVSIATFFVPFVTVLMDESIFRFLIDCQTIEQRERVITTSFCVYLLGCVAFILIAIPLMHFLNYSYTIYASAYIICVSLSGMISALLRGIGRTDQYALFNFLNSALQIILNVLFIAYFKWGLLGMLRASVLAQLIIGLVYIFKFSLYKYIRISLFDKALSKEMMVYSIPLIPNKLSWSIINLSDRIIIMNTLGSAQTGLYAVSNRFPSLMDTVYGFFYQSWKESSARALHGESADKFYNSVYKTLKNFMFSIVIGMIAFMPLVFKIMVNESYHSALVYVPILILAMYFANMSGFYGGIFTAYKQTKIMGSTTVAAAVINLILNLALIIKVGLYAAAFSTLIANFTVYLYRKIKVRDFVKLKESKRKSIIAGIVLLITMLLFYVDISWGIVINCILAFCYAIICNKNIVMMIVSFIRKKGAQIWKQYVS